MRENKGSRMMDIFCLHIWKPKESLTRMEMTPETQVYAGRSKVQFGHTKSERSYRKLAESGVQR